MELLKDYTDAQVRELAEQPTPQPMAGQWTLTAPDGRSWKADSPIRCMHAEMNERIPPLLALARIRRALLDEGKERKSAAWPIKGVRVEGDKVIVAVTGGNAAARWLCGELIAMKDETPNV